MKNGVIAEQVNRKIILLERPKQGKVSAQCFKICEEPVPRVDSGQALVETHYMSIDPAIRTWLSDVKSYAVPIPINETIRSIAIGKVVASKNEEFVIGDVVLGMLGWQQFCLTDGQGLFKINIDGLPLSYFLGVLGIGGGFTSWYGLENIGCIKEGETLVVSAAAGSVGSIVGQLAKIKGARVIGIVGSEEKERLCRDIYHFDEIINYKKSLGRLNEVARELCPKGIDVYFDNVGGEILDVIVPCMNDFGRIVICGTIATDSSSGPRIERKILTSRLKIEGFVISDHMKLYPTFLNQHVGLVSSGKLQHREDVLIGLDKCPQALLRVLEGKNLGKQLVKI